MPAAVFLDRDGVLNKLVFREGRGASPRRFEDFELLPGAGGAVESIRRAGLLAVVVTNQPDLSRGALDPAELDRMHNFLQSTARVHAIYVCPHDGRDRCDCRKPKPGLLLHAAKDLAIELGRSYLVGDSWRDIEAGRAGGCVTLLVAPQDQQRTGVAPHFQVPNLLAAVEVILAHLPHRS